MNPRDINQSDYGDEKLSRINAAGIINITLENLWREAYSAMARGDYTLWNRKLDAIWCILGGDVTEGDTNDKKIKDYNLKIYGFGKLNHKTVGFNSPDEDSTNSSARQYLFLIEKSLFLRRLQNSQGKGTAYESSDDGDFD